MRIITVPNSGISQADRAIWMTRPFDRALDPPPTSGGMRVKEGIHALGFAAVESEGASRAALRRNSSAKGRVKRG